MGQNIEEIAKIEKELIPNVDIDITNKRKRLEEEFEEKNSQINEEGKKEKEKLTQKKIKLIHENKIIDAQLKETLLKKKILMKIHRHHLQHLKKGNVLSALTLIRLLF